MMTRPGWFASAIALAFCFCVTPVAVAISPITLTMDDLPLQRVDGLIHPAGVAFGFTVNGLPNQDARYNSGGPGQQTFVQDPSIEGTTGGILTIDFFNPTPIVEFGVARSHPTSISNAFRVQLFDEDDVVLSNMLVNLQVTQTFAEGRFSYNGGMVKLAVIDFTTSALGPRFAFDNLTFIIPEPSSVALLATGAVGLLAAAWRHRPGSHQP